MHLGHLHLARSARARLDLEAVHFLPAYVPPHKQAVELLPVADRLDLLAAALAAEPAFEVDDFEIRKGARAYTFDTLCELEERAGPGVALSFLIGGDSLLELPGWHRAAELVQRFDLVTVPREPGADPRQLMSSLAGRLPAQLLHKLASRILAVEPLPISSTAIRARVRAGLPIDHLVPAAVAALIARRGYYRG